MSAEPHGKCSVCEGSGFVVLMVRLSQAFPLHPPGQLPTLAEFGMKWNTGEKAEAFVSQESSPCLGCAPLDKSLACPRVENKVQARFGVWSASYPL